MAYAELPANGTWKPDEVGKLEPKRSLAITALAVGEAGAKPVPEYSTRKVSQLFATAWTVMRHVGGRVAAVAKVQTS
jgi:hypothetical protein